MLSPYVAPGYSHRNLLNMNLHFAHDQCAAFIVDEVVELDYERLTKNIASLSFFKIFLTRSVLTARLRAEPYKFYKEFLAICLRMAWLRALYICQTNLKII